MRGGEKEGGGDVWQGRGSELRGKRYERMEDGVREWVAADGDTLGAQE